MKPFNSRFLITLFCFFSPAAFAVTSWQMTGQPLYYESAEASCAAVTSYGKHYDAKNISVSSADCIATDNYYVGSTHTTTHAVTAIPANYGCVYYADGSKAGTTANNTNCSGAGGYQIFSGLDAATPYCTDGAYGSNFSAPSCPSTYTPSGNMTQASAPPPPAAKSPASAPAPAKPAAGAAATAPSTPNAGSNPTNGTGAASSSATTTTNPDGSTTTVTNTTSTTSIDTSSLNQEATQRGINSDTSQISANTAMTAANTDATGVDGTSSGTQATSAVSSSLDAVTSAINSNESANHGLTTTSGFLSQFGSTCGCSPLTLTYHGASVTYDWCPMIAKVRDGLSFIFYVIVAWSIFLMLSEMRV